MTFLPTETQLDAVLSGDRVGELLKACDAARQEPLPTHGTNQHTGGGDNRTSTDRGTTRTYTLRRLARDNPELLSAVGRARKTPIPCASIRRPDALAPGVYINHSSPLILPPSQ